jgi:methylmalonyl-CoA mutase
VADVDDGPVALAADFPPANRDDWLALAGDVARLRTTTYDGITIEPLYTATDSIVDAGLPGVFPFGRARTAAGTRDGWDVRQPIDAAAGTGAAVAELERGATSLWVRLGEATTVDEQPIGRLLDGVLLDIAPVILDAGPRWGDAARAVRSIWRRVGVDPTAVRGSLGADPFGDWAVHRDVTRLDNDLGALPGEARSLHAEHPNVRVATIDGTRFHDAGASDAQELGDVLAVVVATLRTLTEGGLDVDAAFAQVELRLAATVDQFSTIAKFRAARRLLARVAEVADAPDAAGRVPLHAVTSRAMAACYDAAVNIVRSTVACFSAAVGGADAITVLPHDAVANTSASDLATRLARNTQTVLELESNVARVIDPAGGSWYLERLTDELAERAWDVFQEVETAGGIRAAVEQGIVDDRIAGTRAARASDVDHRRTPIIGVSAFPSVDDLASIASGAVTPACPHRWAAGFEALRMRVDAAAAARGRRPSVFLASLGTPATTVRRATAAANFYGIAGLATPRGPASTDIDDVVTAFAASGASVACICAGDDVDSTGRDKLRAALVAAGATRVDSADDLGGDARAALADLLEHLQLR